MKLVISAGHAKKVRGAAGPSPWGLDEVDEARKVTTKTAELLRSQGHDVTTYWDDVSTSQSENLDRIVDFHNAQPPHDYDISIHFNAYETTTTKKMGVECLWKTQEALSAKVSKAMADASDLPNRGAKYRSDLAFLNGTSAKAILVETLFCDAKPDCDAYRARFDAICAALASAISGQAIEAPDRPPVEPEEPEPPETEWPPPGTMPPISAFPPPSARRTLKKGMSGRDVMALQRVLGAPPDGDFGAITDTQVEAFQAAYGLGADGVVGPKTWAKIDELYGSMRAGDEGLSADLSDEIIRTAHDSSLQSYNWPDRGKAAPGYLSGMALSYAVALQRLRDKKADAVRMAKASTGSSADALVLYKKELSAIGCNSDTDGIMTLRTLFTLMIGLGVRESSGKYFCGRDTTAQNVESTTCEAGLFQSSWNLASADPSLPPLLDEFVEDPNGFHREFREGISPDAADLDCYGSGDGATYQFLAKYSPLFAVLTTGVGLRTRKDHWGPVVRHEVTIKREAADLLKDVEKLVLSDAGSA